MRLSLSSSQDTAPDVYETVDTVGAADLVVSPRSSMSTTLVLGANPHTKFQEESSEDEAAQTAQKRGIEPAPVEELDPTSLMSTQEASKKFRKAEKRKGG
jgi:CHASE2 domain-containing sensor protein